MRDAAPIVRRIALMLGTPLWLLPGLASAETFLVEDPTTEDELQAAVVDANGSSDADNTIEFSFDGPSNRITLVNPLPPITPNTLTLDGTEDGLTLDGGGNTILEVRENVRVIDITLENGILSIFADKVLTLDTPANKTSTADIDGAGALTKTGTGTLILTGDLDHTGVTTIEAGALQITSGPGGDIANEGVLEFDIAGNEDYSGVISGSGALTKLGIGVLTLDGLNTYSGQTTVTDGTLRLLAVDDGGTNRFSVEGDVTIGTDGVLGFEIDPMTTETFEGDLDGSGILRKEGAGTLILTGTNTSTGTIELNAGTLQGTSSSIAGDVAVADGTFLVFDQDFDGTYAGDLTTPLSGTVIKRGTGGLRLSGDNTMFPGVLQIETGSVIGDTTSLPRQITNDGALVFDQRSDDTYNGIVSGTGSLEKTGNGTLRFVLDQTYTGPTSILAGRLDVVNANFASAVTVGAGGTLGGTGNLLAPVTVEGRVAPGDGVTPGTLIAAQATFLGSSTLEIEIDSAAAIDRLVLPGTLAITTGASVVPIFNDLDPMAVIQNVPIVISTTGNPGAGVMGEFVRTIELAFQTVRIDPDGDNVNLSIDREMLGNAVQTPNQAQIATALENASAAMVPNELSDAIDALLNSSLSKAQGARALDTMGPEVASQLNTAQLALSQRVGDDVQRRMQTLFSGGAAPLFGSVAPAQEPLVALTSPRGIRPPRIGASSPLRRSKRSRSPATKGGLRSFERGVDELGIGGWLSGYGGYGNLDGDRNAAEADYILAGATLGLDYRLTDNVLVGLGGGWGVTDLDMDDRSADGEAHTFHGLAYAGYATPRFHLGLSGRYATHQLETRRRIAFATVSQTAKGDFDGESYGGRIEAGLNVAGIAGVLFQPIAHFDWTRVEQDGYRETGSPAFNLNVEDESIDSQIGSVGLRIHGAWALPEDRGSFQPELSARWEHQFGDDEREITATLLGDASATPIAIQGADTPTGRALVHVGWVVSSPTGLRATLGYTGAFSSEQMEHGGALSVQYTW